MARLSANFMLFLELVVEGALAIVEVGGPGEVPRTTHDDGLVALRHGAFRCFVRGSCHSSHIGEHA